VTHDFLAASPTDVRERRGRTGGSARTRLRTRSA